MCREISELLDEASDDVRQDEVLFDVAAEKDLAELGQKVEASVEVAADLTRRIQVEDFVVGFRRKILPTDETSKALLDFKVLI